MTRTVRKFLRPYIDGYDMSTYGVSMGPMGSTFDFEAMAAFADEIKGGQLGMVTPVLGPISTFLDNTADEGAHTVLSGANVMRTVLVALGMQAAPAEGDPTFMGEFEQASYQGNPSGGLVTADIAFGPSAVGNALLYDRFWGPLLHEKSVETAANDQAGVDDHGAQTTFGGYMVYQVFTSNGTVAIKVQDASTNSDGNFSDLVSSGDVDASAAPVAGLVALGRGVTVERYLRWQIAFDSADTVTFALGFVRAIR